MLKIRGAAGAEYIILVSLLGAVSIVATLGLGSKISRFFSAAVVGIASPETGNDAGGAPDEQDPAMRLVVNGPFARVGFARVTSLEIDWGDGQTQTTTEDGILEHVYDTPGRYEVVITGQAKTMGATHIFGYDNPTLESVPSFGDLGLEHIRQAFMNSPLVEVGPLPKTVTSLSQAFYRVNGVGPAGIEAWDISNVTSLYSTFQAAYEFNRDISGWNTSNVTVFEETFASADSFNQPIGGWDVSKGLYFNQMFFGAENFNQPIGAWDVTSSTTFRQMFAYATSFNQPLADWDMSGALYLPSMFQNSNFNQPLNTWDVSSVTNMRAMFANATFNQPLDQWNTANVSWMRSMFENNSDYNQDLSLWCVINADADRSDFDTGAANWVLPKPVFGTCP